MAEIDNLNIVISAESKSASTAIDNLISKLNKLETNLSSLGKANVSGLSGVTSDVAKAVKNLDGLNTATFTRVANTFKKLSSIDSTSIYALSNALNGLGTASQGAQNVGDLAKNLSKLGNKGVQNAITNIPQLATAMNQLLTTLSKSPKVSNNIIQMTNALANLASQGQKISVASNAMANGINRYSASARNAKKHTTSLAAAFGKFYASYFLVIRGIKALWGTVETASDYLETLNYFEEAFGQVAKTADLSQWEALGYESAEAYANSFSKRASELTAKMTGFQVLSDGTLQSTGLGSLGINPSDVMQYQAMFGQMSSSMGVASETALKLSDALTMIGADLASVRNMKFEDVWTDMASGLAGMSRTLDKYGVNIRNVNLQQKLNELGIEANIQALNQNEKELLRGIILLENTQYAWGDLAETLNAPANQLRLLSSNTENLSRIIGSLFLPTVQKVLPYINGFVIALQRLFAWVGTAMGIDLSGIVESTGENPIDSIIDGSEELEETLADTLEASEKLKKSLRGFDELKTISSETASLTTGTDVSLGITGGVLDTAFEQSLAEYQKAWDEAFANMENKAEEFADKISKYLEPLKGIFEGISIGDYISVGENFSGILIGITELFENAIENVDWYALGEDIGDFVGNIDWTTVFSNIGDIIFVAIQGALEAWQGAFDASPIETTIITAVGLLTWSGLPLAIVKSMAKSFTIPNFTSALSSVFAIGGSVPSVEVIGTKIIEIVEGIIEDSFGKEVLDAMAAGLFVATGAGIGAIFGGPIGALVGGLIALIIGAFSGEEYGNTTFTAIGKWFEENVVPWFTKEKWQELGVIAGKAIGEKLMAFETWWSNTKIVQWWSKSVMPWFTKERWNNLANQAKEGIKEKWEEFSTWWSSNAISKWYNEKVKPFFDKEKWTWSGIKTGLSEAFNNAIDAVKEIWNSFANWLNEKLTFEIPSLEIDTFWGKEIFFKGMTINLGKIPTFSGGYENGGFPKSYSMFMAGEDGKTELLGTVGGKTAVAGGAEITGISDAVYSTGQTTAELLSTAVGLLNVIAQKEFGITDSQVFNSVRRSENENYRRTGNSVFVH